MSKQDKYYEHYEDCDNQMRNENVVHYKDKVKFKEYYKEKIDKEFDEAAKKVARKINIHVVIFGSVVAVVGFGAGYLFGQKHVIDNSVLIKCF